MQPHSVEHSMATASPRQISADGLALIKEFEGLFLEAYQDGGE